MAGCLLKLYHLFDTAGADGTDTLTNIEFIEFDQTIETTSTTTPLLSGVRWSDSFLAGAKQEQDRQLFKQQLAAFGDQNRLRITTRSHVKLRWVVFWMQFFHRNGQVNQINAANYGNAEL